MSNFAKPWGRIPVWYYYALRSAYPKWFTTALAVQFYVEHRKKSKTGMTPDSYWVEMNARNALSCMVQVGLLRRVSRGNYRWTTQAYKAMGGE